VRGQTNGIAPGPTGIAWIRSLVGLEGPEPVRCLLEWTRAYGDIVRFRIGWSVFHLLNDVASARHVLQHNYRNYTKSRNFDEVRRVLGNGLLTSEGEFWLRQRRLAQPAFHQDRLAACTGTVVEATERRLDAWAAAAASGEPIDVHEQMLGLTLRIVGRILFDVDLEREERRVGPALTVVMRHVNRRLKSIVTLPPAVPTPAERRFRRALAELDDLVLTIIRDRAATAEDRGDLLSMLRAARDPETGEPMSEAQIRDEVMTLLLAGHETTAGALSWTFHLLSQHLDVQRQMQDEIDDVLGGRLPQHADLARLRYARSVLQEAMRLYPPAWLIERQVIADDEVCGVRIPAGSMVGISPYTLHRNPGLWPDPERFDPHRFSPEASAERSRYAYLPFGAGPRVCIGAGLAMLDAHVILVMVAQRFTVASDPAHTVELEPLTTLRPRTGIRLRLSRRPQAVQDVASRQSAAAIT
jgi:cytochrome P450